MRNASLLFLVSAGAVSGLAGGDPAAAADVSAPTVDLSIYRQVVEVWFVVADLDRTVNYWERLGLRNIRRIGTEEAHPIGNRGGRSPFTVKMARGQIGDVEIVWVEPGKGAGEFNRFLTRHGDGVHHLTFAVKSQEELEKQVQYFRSKGVPVMMEGKWKGLQGERHFVYLDTAERGGGITYELAFNTGVPASVPSQNEEPFNKLTQYAFVAHDLKRVGTFYENLGFGSMPLSYITNLDRNYRGTPGNFEMYIGYWRWGTVNFEWIQSAVGPSVFEEYLKKRGEGLHHLAFNVTDLDAAVAKMEAKGLKVAQSGRFDYPKNKGRFAYIDTEPRCGVMIEFNWHQPLKP